MIHDITLTPDQHRSLEQQLEDRLKDDSTHDVTGLEVTSITEYRPNEEYRVFYCYERNNKDVKGSAFLKFSIRHNRIEDLRWSDQP